MLTVRARDLRPGDVVETDLGMRYVRDVTLLNNGRTGYLVTFEVDEHPDGEIDVVMDADARLRVEGGVQPGNLREALARRIA